MRVLTLMREQKKNSPMGDLSLSFSTFQLRGFKKEMLTTPFLHFNFKKNFFCVFMLFRRCATRYNNKRITPAFDNALVNILRGRSSRFFLPIFLPCFYP